MLNRGIHANNKLNNFGCFRQKLFLLNSLPRHYEKFNSRRISCFMSKPKVIYRLREVCRLTFYDVQLARQVCTLDKKRCKIHVFLHSSIMILGPNKMFHDPLQQIIDFFLSRKTTVVGDWTSPTGVRPRCVGLILSTKQR